MDLPNTPVRVGNTTPRKVVTKLRNALAGRYYQLLTSHAAGLGNKTITKMASDARGAEETNGRRSVHRLSVKSEAPRPQI